GRAILEFGAKRLIAKFRIALRAILPPFVTHSSTLSRLFQQFSALRATSQIQGILGQFFAEFEPISRRNSRPNLRVFAKEFKADCPPHCPPYCPAFSAGREGVPGCPLTM
ncbi:hypothetical protein ACIRD3_40015, partial [Kitasatospora sp. NPDC093550]|uniref:hypothetical protein n=1 Tax=Kitasatospora sp. NPDC093550 TaxID=3364089 RepID=UPI003818CCAC